MIILIFVCNILITHSYVLRDAYNLLLTDGDDYKIDLVINEDDYEMIDQKQLKQFHVDKDKFKALDKIARKKARKITTRLNNIASFHRDRDMYDTKMSWNTNLHKDANIVNKLKLRKSLTMSNIDVKTPHSTKLTPHAIMKKETESDYNYNDLINEYYDQTDNETVSLNFSETPEYDIINTLKRIFSLQYEASNCKSSIGLYAIRCLAYDFNNRRQTTKEIVIRVWNIARIWLLVYLIVAVPLWCTKGWCCCCLCCKFFKPWQTIEEAKKYLVLNPPGVFKTKNGEVHYNPTEQEKDSYEEFEHFIKVL